MTDLKKRKKIKSILVQMSSQEYMTAKDIADQLDVSEKTARSYISEINIAIKEYGAEIISRPRYGFHLQISNTEKWNAYMNSQSPSKDALSSDSEDRVSMVALKLLLAADYYKISDFAEQLFVSPQIISQTLKDCEALFSYFHLKLERKPYYGLRLIGSEFNKRNCIVSCFPNEFDSFMNEYPDSDGTINKILDIVIFSLQNHHIHLTQISLQSAAAYIYLSINRYRAGFQIVSGNEKNENTRSYAAAAEIFRELIPGISDPEICHLGIYISAMRSNMSEDIHANAVITKHIDDLTTKIFESIRHIYKVDFTNNLILRMMLSKHLISLDIRIRYRINLANDVYMDIQQSFPYAYSLANEAVAVLKREYQLTIPASETDWLALIFATGLQNMKSLQKLNLLVVCEAGRASSQLLKYQIERNYSEYVNTVSFSTLHELPYIDLSNIDYILSTVNVVLPVNIPIMMVDDISLFSRSSSIESELISHRLSVIDRFFRPDLFFTDIRATDKEDILKQLCQRMGNITELPEGFYESLLERENLHTTDYSPYVALPHPTKLTTENDIVAVAVLDKPVFWGRYEIQVLLCVLLSLDNEESTQLFYDVTSHFITDKKMVEQLIKCPNFSTLIGLLGTVKIE